MPINIKAPLEIRDGRNGNWFWVDKEVWADDRLSSSDKVVYGSVAYFANNKTQEAYPSIISISKFSKVSDRQAYRSIKSLERFKYLAVKRQRGKPNVYTLLETPAKLSVVTQSQKTPDKTTVVTPDKKGVRTRINKNKNKRTRINKRKKYSSIKDIKEKDLVEISEKYKVPLSFVKLQFEKMENWLGAKGRRYKNYRRALMNWVLSGAENKVERNQGGAVDARNI